MSDKTPRAASHATATIRLIRSLIDQHGAELFHDSHGECYLYAPVFVEAGQIAFYKTFLLKSSACRAYLRRSYYNATGKSISSNALKDAIETVAGNAVLGAARPVYIRLASFVDRVVLDLGTENHFVVTITRDGWAVGPCPANVRFVRPEGSGALPLPLPVRSAESLMDLLPQVLNITDRESILLLLAWWIVGLRGRGPFLVLAVRGGSGTAKSNALLIIRGVLDPNSATKNHLSRDQRDLVISVANCYVASFDNVSYIPEDIADAICVLATGGGLRTRKLHTDAEEAIFSKTAPVVVNGIPDVIGRPDLAARSVVVELRAISDRDRKTEAELERTKQEILPRILGRLLDVVVGVLQREGTTRPATLPRMADVAVTLTAAETALDLKDGTFIELLNRQSDAAADAVLESHEELFPLVMKITNDGTRAWSGELKELLTHIPRVDEHQKPWTPKRLGNAFRRLNDVLPRVGLRIVAPHAQRWSGTTRGKRVWRVEPVPSQGGLPEAA